MKQAEAVNLSSHPLEGTSLIEASAGTGKTYTITHLYVRSLLEKKIKVNQLLVVTFTNAATQELKGRIRELIYNVWSYLSNPELIDENFDVLFGQYRNNRDAIFSLQEALINFDEAAIYSIHGFCQRVLNVFPVETNSLLQQQIIPDEKEIEQSAIRDFWREHIVTMKIKKLRWLMGYWKHPDDLLKDIRPLLGFEETVDQFSHKLETVSDEEDIEAVWQQLVSLWKSSSEEVTEFLLHSKALNKNKVRVATVNVLFEELVDFFSEEIPYSLPKKWELLTASKLATCVLKNAQDDRLNLPFFNLADKFGQYHEQWINSQKLELLIQATNSVRENVTKTKSMAQNISFNDLIEKLSTQLKSENISLIDKVNTMYPFAMVDEFQDTDNKQYNIFKKLYQQTDNKTLILIGDPKQAIYSFRGADVFTYQKAKKSTHNHYTLDTNYRSTEQYINIVNSVFEYNQNAFIFNQLIEFSSSKANINKPKTIIDGDQHIAPLVSWIHPYSDKPVTKAAASDYFSSVCANEIYNILQQKTLLLDGKKVAAKDLTILVKTGKQASLMKNKLAERGISSALILRDSVFSSDQAREISLLLEVLNDASNIRRLSGLLSTDLFNWNARQINQLQDDNQLLGELLEQIKDYQLLWHEKGILSMFFRLMEDQKVLFKNSGYMDGDRRITNWMHIIELLQQQASEHASFSQAQHWLMQQRESAKDNNQEEHQLRLESDSNLVSIVTIHKSKGLQYPIVFLPFMWDVKGSRNKPKSYSYHDESGTKKIMILDEAQRERWHQENLGEEIRLFYVAMTRAIYRCYLGWGHIKGAGSSAIANCLFTKHIKKMAYPQNMEFNNANELRTPFDELNQKQHNVDIIESIDFQFLPKHQKKAVQKQVPAKIFNRIVQQQWRISSYSQIATSSFTQEIDKPDYDAEKKPVNEDSIIENVDELNRFNFQKGAKAGNFLHDILENQPFHSAIDEELIRNKCREYGFEEKWVSCVAIWVEDVLQTDLGGFSLCQLKSGQKISEMEFYLCCNHLQADELNRLLHQYQYSRPEQNFTFSSINGFLKGFIDLVFEYDGRYYIGDYKSNFLGSELNNYNEESCKEAMYHHHYHLQYMVYSIALHRYLQQRINNYDYQQHFGGVYYLFLRGMSKSDTKNNGIYFHKPEHSAIQKIDRLFDNG